MGIPSIIIMDFTVRKEKVIELRRECRVLKRKQKNLIETNECHEILGVQGASISIVGGVVYYSYCSFLQDYNSLKVRFIGATPS